MKTQRPNNNPPPANDNILDNIEDEHFVAALSEAFRTFKTIQTHMNAAGYPTTTNIICKRMNEFVEMFPEVIEKRGKSWRIVPTGQEIVPAPVLTTPAIVPDFKPLAINTVHHGDCMTLMKRIPDQSVNLILVDPPYGTTRCSSNGRKIDVPLKTLSLWEQYFRILAPGGNIVMFGSQPFSLDMMIAGRKWFKYSNIWMKENPTGMNHVRNKPMKDYEDIMVFSPGNTAHAATEHKKGSGFTKNRATYNPWRATEVVAKNRSKHTDTIVYLGQATDYADGREYPGLENCPRMVFHCPKDKAPKGEKAHPFAKPVALLDDLIRLYSNEGEIVLDNCAGSGSTAVAAIGAGRQWIAIEKDDHWFEFAKARIAKTISELAANNVATVPEIVAANDDQPVAANDDTVPAVAKSVEVIAPGITLHHGDCLEVMRSMPSGSFDGIVTSPPYNKSKRRKGKGNKVWSGGAYDGCTDDMTFDAWKAWMRDFLSESWRLLADDGAIFFNYKNQIIDGVMMTAHDFQPDEVLLRQVVCWDRGSDPNSSPTYFQRNSESIYVFAKPGWKCAKTGLGEVWRVRAEMNNDHPAPFPVEIPLRCITASKGCRILDPFSGSGTTGIAAIREGRSYTGIEQSREYLNKSKLRLLNELKDIAA
ncbi:DNA methyltransferase [Sphingomonas sp. 4RDLI-65]|uniref:DNA-methyltransferase n=1 Tax=Sphingomonas sp. 4RDLI-65 TaxID=3111641 RepID=UPI003C2302F6